jgi:hypothetical protein
MTPHDEQDFREFVVGQWQPLLRTAYLLTGEGAGPFAGGAGDRWSDQLDAP